MGSCVNRNELKCREFTGKRHKGTFRGLIWEVAPQTQVHVKRQKVSNFSSFFYKLERCAEFTQTGTVENTGDEPGTQP